MPEKLKETLERLEKNLYAERVAVKIYYYESQKVKDTDVALLLRSVASTEAYHASLLAETIKKLGDEVKPGIPYDESRITELVDSMKTDEDILRLNIILEDQAFNSYKEDALFVEDPSIAKILENIMKDEASHSERFYESLADAQRRKRGGRGESSSSIPTSSREGNKEAFKALVRDVYVGGYRCCSCYLWCCSYGSSSRSHF